MISAKRGLNKDEKKYILLLTCHNQTRNPSLPEKNPPIPNVLD
jgi:hypothetical protein